MKLFDQLKEWQTRVREWATRRQTPVVAQVIAAVAPVPLDKQLLGLHLKRVQAGLTVEQLSDKLQVSRKTIENAERGGPLPDVATVNKLLRFMGLPDA